MGKLRKKWTEKQLQDALAAVRLGKSASSISKETGIAKSTIISKLKGYRPIGKSVGPRSILSSEEEATLIRWIFHLSKQGFPITKTQLLSNVGHLVKRLQRDSPFRMGKPGRSWYEGFLRRHPEITNRIAQNLPRSRSSITEASLRGWFGEVKQHLDEKQLTDINGSRIFNLDESAFYLCPKGERVLVKKGDKAVYNFIHNDDKECLTVLFVTNAEGALPPPMIVFPYERVPYSVSLSVPSDWSIGKSESGWMTSEIFFEYMCNVFEPWLKAQNIERPVLLYVDGRSSHLTLPVAEFCTEHQIELIALYPNATHLIQPLDVAFFRPLKAMWRNCVNEWRIKNERKLRKEDFGPLLKQAVSCMNLPQIMSNGFRKTGLYPFSAEALAYNALLKKQKEISLTKTTVSKTEVVNNLMFIEKNIDAILIEQFKEANKTGTWNGSLENLGLFLFWQKINKLSST